MIARLTRHLRHGTSTRPAAFVARLAFLPTITLVASLALLAGPVQAQKPDAKNPPVTWCTHPASSPEWRRQVAYFTVRFESPDSTSHAQKLLRPYLPFILGGIAREYVLAHQPARDPELVGPALAPPGEPRYQAVHVMGPGLRFDLRGSGAVDSIHVLEDSSFSLIEDVKAALASAIQRGDVFGPYADSSVRTRIVLDAGLGWLTEEARWPAFTVNAPVSADAMADPKNRAPHYPPGARGWEGRLLLRYIVDEKGRADTSSVQVVNQNHPVWPSDQHYQAFVAFKDAVITALARMRFRPAVHRGCFVATWVQQEFSFQIQ